MNTTNTACTTPHILSHTTPPIASTRPTSPNTTAHMTLLPSTQLTTQAPTPYNPYLKAIWKTLITHHLHCICLQTITWAHHVLNAHHNSLISTVVTHFHPLERTKAWEAATRTISQSLFPALWATEALYSSITQIIATLLHDTQWTQHIPLDSILSQPSPPASLALHITIFTQRITTPLTTLTHEITSRLAHSTGLLSRCHIMYHPGFVIDTIETHMEHYGTILLKGLGHIIGQGISHLTAHFTNQSYLPPALLHRTPNTLHLPQLALKSLPPPPRNPICAPLPQLLPQDILPPPPRIATRYHSHLHSTQDQAPPSHMHAPYADSITHVDIILNVMEAELCGLVRLTIIPHIKSHFHLRHVPTTTTTHTAYTAHINYLLAPLREHVERTKYLLRTLTLTILTLPPSQRLPHLLQLAMTPPFTLLDTQLTALTNTTIANTIHTQPYWFSRHEDDLTFHPPTSSIQNAPFVAPAHNAPCPINLTHLLAQAHDITGNSLQILCQGLEQITALHPDRSPHTLTQPPPYL